MQRWHVVAAAAVAALAFGPDRADAQNVEGTLSFAGTADVIHTEEHDLFVRFVSGVITGQPSSTGAFASLAGTSGGIRDFEVVNGPQSIPGLVTLGGYTFDLLEMLPGTSAPDDCLVAPLPGQSCTPPRHDVEGVFTPFTLVNLASGDPNAPINSLAWFDVRGMVRGPGSIAASPFAGRFQASFQGMSYQEVLFTVESTGLQNVAFTGTFTTAPEPSTYALMATGLLGVVGAARRRRRR